MCFLAFSVYWAKKTGQVLSSQKRLFLKGAQNKSLSSPRLLGFRNNVLWSTPEDSSGLSWMCPVCIAEANWKAVMKEQKRFVGE